MTEFTPQQLRNWWAYEKVRQGGRYNMFDSRARRTTGLDPTEYVFVMEHYRELQLQANFQGKKGLRDAQN